MAATNGQDLNNFLTGLEYFYKKGKTHVCVIPYSSEDPHLVGEYSWVTTSTEGGWTASEHVENDAKLYVATRNYSLHKYLVAFSIAPQCSAVLLRKTPGGKPASVYDGQLIAVPRPPSRNPGDADCKGCGILVEETFDPVVVFDCDFKVTHEGAQVGADRGNMQLLLRGI